MEISGDAGLQALGEFFAIGRLLAYDVTTFPFSTFRHASSRLFRYARTSLLHHVDILLSRYLEDFFQKYDSTFRIRVPKLSGHSGRKRRADVGTILDVAFTHKSARALANYSIFCESWGAWAQRFILQCYSEETQAECCTLQSVEHFVRWKFIPW